MLLMGKSTISTGPFSIAFCYFTRGYRILKVVLSSSTLGMWDYVGSKKRLMMLMNILWIKNLLQNLGRGLVRPPSKKAYQRGTGHQKPRRLLCLSATAGRKIGGCCGKELKRNIINTSRAQGIWDATHGGPPCSYWVSHKFFLYWSMAVVLCNWSRSMQKFHIAVAQNHWHPKYSNMVWLDGTSAFCQPSAAAPLQSIGPIGKEVS